MHRNRFQASLVWRRCAVPFALTCLLAPCTAIGREQPAAQTDVIHGNALPVGAGGSAPLPLDPLRASFSWTLESNKPNSSFGRSVASAGDVNGDGYDDVLVGTSTYQTGAANIGRAMVFHGSPNGPSLTPNWYAESGQGNDAFAHLVAPAGDVNGDGFDDVIVGAYYFDNGQTDEGRAFLYLGSANGLSAAPSWTTEGDQTYAFFGGSVASAGDVNGDGYDDLIIGAFAYDNGGVKGGRAFVYYGSPTGPGAAPDWSAGCDQEFAAFGRSVASAGDVNGDSYDDVIIGAYGYLDQDGDGRVFVFHGSPNGPGQTPDWSAGSGQQFAGFGISVSSAGDVNGDGFNDVIVGAYTCPTSYAYEGKALVFEGSALGLNAEPSWTTVGQQPSAYLGLSVSGAGDLNGDGYDDVIVGAYQFDHGQTDEGRALLYRGSATGLSPIAGWTTEADQAEALLGISVAGAGDVNGDGIDDMVIGAMNFDNGQFNEGRVFLFPGSLTCPGDGDGDRYVSFADITAALASYGTAGPAGDANHDGAVDLLDITTVLASFGSSCP